VRILVLTSEPVTPGALRAALPQEIDLEDAEIMVVAPALQKSAFHFWMSDPDDAIARAEEVREESLADLGDGGISATANTGDSDPEVAIEDALKTFEADRIVLFSHSSKDEQHYREAVDVASIESRFGIPVSEADV
jgi:hypothetical protein